MCIAELKYAEPHDYIVELMATMASDRSSISLKILIILAVVESLSWLIVTVLSTCYGVT